MMDLVFIALLQAFAGDPAPPADTAQAAPTANEQPADQATEPVETPETERGQVRCRREPIVGTRLARRVCTTAAQDRALEEDARNMVNRAQSQHPSRSQ